MQRTIPQLLTDAASRTPDRVWLRTDDGQLTFAEAAGEVGGGAAKLAELGIGRGDLVMLTARNTPPYLLAWLAVSALGAIAVSVNPVSTQAELAGLLEQTSPKLVITDSELRPHFLASGVPLIDVDELGGARGEVPTGEARRTTSRS